ncbi:Phage P2 GpU [compost metagenome]
MTIDLHNEFTDLTKAHVDLTDMAEQQIPRGLVVGTETLGMFVIREMPRTITETTASGIIVAMSYQLTLVEIREEEAGQ